MTRATSGYAVVTRDGPDDPGALVPVFAIGDREAFLRVLGEMSRKHWDTEIRALASQLLAKAQPPPRTP